MLQAIKTLQEISLLPALEKRCAVTCRYMLPDCCSYRVGVQLASAVQYVDGMAARQGKEPILSAASILMLR
jgi:hypothetical protein